MKMDSCILYYAEEWGKKRKKSGGVCVWERERDEMKASKNARVKILSSTIVIFA